MEGTPAAPSPCRDWLLLGAEGLGLLGQPTLIVLASSVKQNIEKYKKHHNKHPLPKINAFNILSHFLQILRTEPLLRPSQSPPRSPPLAARPSPRFLIRLGVRSTLSLSAMATCVVHLGTARQLF